MTSEDHKIPTPKEFLAKQDDKKRKKEKS